MIKETLKSISDNFNTLAEIAEDDIQAAYELMLSSIKQGGKIIYCGNGGSAADSQHLAAELIGRYRRDRSPLPAIALTTDTSIITAIANDYSFDQIFSRQLKAIGKENDVLYAISTSGNSKNIIEAMKIANLMNIKVIGLTGTDSAKMQEHSDILIKVPSDRADRIQEMHIAVGQIICELIEENMFSR